MLQLDFRDKRPLYEQLMEQITSLILRGVLEPDSQLPSVRQLALELSINPNTIQRAYSLLEAQNIIYTVKGRGSFVSAGGQALRQRKVQQLYQQLMETYRQLLTLSERPEDIQEYLTKGVRQ